MKIYLFLLAIVVHCSGLEDKCPDAADLSPCSCNTHMDGACVISCSLVVQEDLKRLADIPELCGGHAHFVLVHSKVSGIPAGLWKTLLSSETVDVSIAHSRIERLVPDDAEDIPEAHTPGSAVIKIDHTEVGRWDWKQLQKFRSDGELTLVIDDTPLTEISPDFRQIAGGQVHKVEIDSAGLAELPDGIFAGFEDLRSLSLQNNGITSISRSLMPRPANKLEFLHLNGNELTSIPGDLFADMPSLEVVYLRNNKLTALPDELFQSISSQKLQRIDLIRNPWECNCELMWIARSTKQHVQLGVCETPESLSGKKVKDLSSLLNC